MTACGARAVTCRIAHAHRPGPTQPHERRHRREHQRRSSTRSPMPPRAARICSSRRRWPFPATASAIWSRTPGSSPPTSARCSASPPPPRPSPPSSASSITIRRSETTAARCSSTTPRRSWRTDACGTEPTSRCCRTTATSTTSATSHPRARATRSTSPSAGRSVEAGRLDLRRHVGRVLRRQAAAGTGREGRGHPRQHQRVALLPRQAARARCAHPPAHRAARQAVRLCEHLGRRRQREEHHPVRRREPGLRRRRPAARHRPAVRRRAADRRSGSGRRGAADRASPRSSANARCTTRS